MKLPKKFLVIFFLLVLVVQSALWASSVKAEWVADPEVTAVGKSAERSRQLLFWLFSRPSLDNSPAIRTMWTTSRNIALVLFFIIVIVFGFQLIVSKEKAKFESFLPKLGGMIVFCVFSYVLVLGLIQLSDVFMKFFIQRVAGENLFNITFVGGNIEENYTNFAGMRENSPENVESAKTGLFLIRTTTLTYNIIFIILVLRKIFLWFLLVISPFLPLLFAFPLVKNVGWVWIGVFFQWLFYGPLFSVFLAGLVKIWEIGIPYVFDFSRVGTIIYPTAINILYGGPKQLLSATNTANFVDTYAEYVIGLIMLWAVILLPWLLLRTFRDYCCEILKSLEAATLTLYGKLGGITMPPSVSPFLSRMAKFELPFKRQISTTAFETSRVSKMKTEDILGSVGLKISSLTDVSRFDMDLEQRRAASQKLDRLHSPANVPDVSLRREFSLLNQELISRATKGDTVAERTLNAASKAPVSVVMKLMQRQKEVVPAERGKPGIRPVGFAPVIPLRTVSVEDYESVKKMWIKNYLEGDIPISDEIKTREDWLGSEVAKISDTIEMLASKDEVRKQTGFERVSVILPFLLLGGFTEEQSLIYLKAKLEAAKQVQQELEQERKIGEEVAKEELVEVPAAKKEEKMKAAELKEELKMQSPKKE